VIVISDNSALSTLAWENRNASRLILDEKQGRRVAEALGLPKTGILGIIAEAIERIIQTGFHINQSLIDAVRSQLNVP
jgi:predicted nucleic acid-binding protein